MISLHSQLLWPMQLLQINVYRVQCVAQWVMSKDLKEKLIKMAMRVFGAIFSLYLTNYIKPEGKIMLSLLKKDKSFRSESLKKPNWIALLWIFEFETLVFLSTNVKYLLSVHLINIYWPTADNLMAKWVFLKGISKPNFSKAAFLTNFL